ncbi:response regulator [Paenibacillus aurantius]|uniref:Response regulator n=1 Tax=Paenibacillus aurantius TaxID=2918900 RepID=A0AA96RGY2_9BACL|nr:response regulator [Paenibacillus aurantius]WNQ12956.1 response regulator [Paenibacillus aurantius]
MYQLLIVDDEPSVVDAIAHTLPWGDLGVEDVLCAYSGQEALDIVKRQVVDIVITDIRMPGMNGIQLIEQIRRFSRHTEVILLTGYAEFEYAKQGLQLQAADYLLKPVSDEDLTDSIRKVIRKLTQEGEESAVYRKAAELLKEHQPALKSEMLAVLLEQGRVDSENSLSMIGVPFAPGDPISLVLIRLEGRFHEYNRRDRLLMEFSVGNMAEEIFGPFFETWSCRDRYDYLVLALRSKEPEGNGNGQELLSRLCSQLQHSVMLFLHSEISVVIGNPALYPDSLPGSYQSALKTMRRGIGKDEGLLMTVNDPVKAPAAALKTLHEPPSLLHLFEAGMWEEAARKLERIAEELDQVWIDSPELLAEWYHALASACYHYAHVNEETLGQLFERIGEHDGLPEMGKLLSVTRMKEWGLGLCRRLSLDNSEEIRDTRGLAVKQVKDYIHTHLEKDVSLHVLAEQVHLHPVYLSKVFKLETGEGLKEYLHRVRMERAVHLLKSSEMKVYEITASVGYLNTPYFIKVFKKEFGMTPQEYRDHHLPLNAGEPL